jgi:hypothetical protein
MLNGVAHKLCGDERDGYALFGRQHQYCRRDETFDVESARRLQNVGAKPCEKLIKIDTASARVMQLSMVCRICTTREATSASRQSGL